MAATTTGHREAAERAELLARALADFERFCGSLIWIAPKDGPRATLRFNPIQRKYNAARTWRDVVLKGRQIGLSTIELARDVWRFLQPGQRVIVLCQSQTDHAILNKLSDDLVRMFDGLKRAGLSLPFGTETRTSWTLPHRDSTLTLIEAGASEAAAQKKGRGGTFTRVHATEVAMWEYPEQSLNALLEAVPRAPHTEVVFESTPRGVGNFFHQKFVDAQSRRGDYTAHFFAWFDDPTYAVPLSPGEVLEPENDRERELVDVHGCSAEQLKWYRAKVIDKGQDLTDQEYPSDPFRCFLTKGRTFFDMKALDAMGLQQRAPIEVRDGGDVRIWRRARGGSESFVLGVDAAEGLGDDGDWTYGTIWSRRSKEHVATVQTKARENIAADKLIAIAREFNDAEIVVERNKGLAIIGAIERAGYRGVFYDEDDKPGIFTSTASRPAMLADLASAVRDGSLTTSDAALIEQMRAFVIDGRTGRPFAPGKHLKNGTGDDGIFSCAMAWAVLLRPSPDLEVHVGGARSFGGELTPDAVGNVDPWAAGRGW